jgi:hypothetical protein
MDHAPQLVDYRTEPSRYRHWTLSFDGAVATLAMDVDEDAGLRPGYKLKLNSVRPRRRHRAARRAEPDPLRAPRGAHGGGHEPEGPDLLLGREHLHARPVAARLEGELLQVHQRDPQRHRGRSRHSG